MAWAKGSAKFSEKQLGLQKLFFSSELGFAIPKQVVVEYIILYTRSPNML